MNPTRTLTAMVVIFALLAGSGMAPADDTLTLAKIDQCLAAVQTFAYGQGGGPLTELERTIFQLPADSPLRATVEQKLIQAIDGANPVGRGVICRQLRAVGTERCVPAVAKMLDHPELSSFARYTLEGIGCPAALQAMHRAINKTTGKEQIGLINSLADSGYQPIRADCVALVRSPDPALASAAARALGRLGGTEAVAALIAARDAAADQLTANIDLALLNSAAALRAKGKLENAAKVYAALRQPGGPLQLAGLRGLVLAQPDNAADLLVEAIRRDNAETAAFAISLTSLAKGADATAKFVTQLHELPPQTQVLLLKALGTRGDAQAVPAIVAAIKTGDEPVQRAGLEALGGLPGDRSAIETLVDAAATRSGTGATITQASLARLDGADVNPILIRLAQGKNAGRSAAAIKALAARHTTQSVAMLFVLAKDDRPTTRTAAIDALGALGGQRDIAALVQLAAKPHAANDRQAIEASLRRVLTRIEDPADRAAPLLAALPSASAAVRPVLIRQLGRAGTAEALTAVRAALKHSDTATSDAAVAAMVDWPDKAVADDLIQIVESARTSAIKTAALTGYLRIALASDDPNALLLDALKKVDTVGDKKLILNEIGLRSETLDALELTQALLADRQLQASAAIATVRIAYKLRNKHRDKARVAIDNVLVTVAHPDVQTRAQDVLNDIDKNEDHILQWVAIGPFVGDKILSGTQNYQTAFAPDKADTSGLKWQPLTKGIRSWDIDLEATYGAMDHCSAYLRTMVWSPIDQDVQVEGGCDDALKIWVNGKLVFDDHRVSGAAPRTMRAPAKLRKGWNELKLKAVDHEGGWTFGCRIRKPNGGKLERLKFEAR